MTQIVAADLKDVSLIHHLANEIWPVTYSAILSQEQINFMLEENYSKSALTQAIQTQQHQFFILYDQSEAIGFMALHFLSQILRIEKLYLKPIGQGKGFGKKLIDFAATKALQSNVYILELNVNRGNNAYNFYLKQGFEVVKILDIPYYQFILDDYVMQKKLIS